MIVDVRDLLPLYALGVLDADEARAVERAVAGDPALAVELAAFQQAAEQLVVPVAPSAEVKTRLLASVGGGRFEVFSSRMGAMFDVSVERARELLGLIERTASWETAMPGIALVHFDGGPACASADCGFIRIAPGKTFPLHTHRGEELSLILAGKVRERSTGRLLGVGDELVMAVGSAHDLTVEGDEDGIFAARAFDGIEIAGARATKA